MTRSTLSAFALGLTLFACGVDEKQDVKSADAWLAEQEQAGEKQMQEQEKQKGAYDEPTTTEDEKKRQWDDKQADLELRRAGRSAETCPDSVTEKAPKGVATVTLVFSNDGRVKEAKISSEYEDKAVGTCVLRAMQNVIVPAYQGEEHTVEWDVDLTGAKKASGPKEKKGD
jgi:hypothetical protein